MANSNVEKIKPPEPKEDEPKKEEIEQKPESFEEVVEKQGKEVESQINKLQKKGEVFEDILKKSGAESDEITEFNKGQEEIENKADQAEKEYKVSVTEGESKEEKEKSKEEEFFDYLEQEGYLDIEEIKNKYLEIKNRYKEQLIEQNKEPRSGKLWDDLILRETDKNYAEYLKTKVSDSDKTLINDYLSSDDENRMPLSKRQAFLNLFFRNHYRLYANEKGEMVSMTDYLRDYYKNLGMNVEIEFKTIDPDIKRDLAQKVLKSEFLLQGMKDKEAFEKAFYAAKSGDKKIKYILNDEIAIPHLIIEKKETKKETPLIAGSDNQHGPLRSEEKDESGKRKRKGNFIQTLTVHAPEFSESIQRLISSNIHEIDHAIKKTMPTKEQDKLDQGLLAEATAGKAGIDFMNVQHKHLKDNPLAKNLDGFDYQAMLEQVVGRFDVGEETPTGKEYRYAQDYIIADGYEKKEGKDKYKKLFYTGELDLNEELGDVVKTRERIENELKKEKPILTKIMRGELEE